MKKRPDRIERYIDLVIRWRWLVIAVSLAVALGVGTGARHLGLATNYRVFFGDDNPDLLAFEALEQVFTKNDSVLFVVKPESGTVFEPRTLELVDELTERARPELRRLIPSGDFCRRRHQGGIQSGQRDRGRERLALS